MGGAPVELLLRDLGDHSGAGADLSACGRYRWRLWRRWHTGAPSLLWVMLNPSTADASTDDPTIKKCRGFSARAGFGGLEVVNLYAYRATHPGMLKSVDDPVGPENNARLALSLYEAAAVVFAWGAAKVPGKAERVAFVERLRVRATRPLLVWHLGTTSSGDARHPLMLAYATRFEPWNGGGR